MYCWHRQIHLDDKSLLEVSSYLIAAFLEGDGALGVLNSTLALLCL